MRNIETRAKARSAGASLVLALALVGGAAPPASAAHYHVNCVAHGLVHGSSTTDGAAHGRVESGCSGVSFCKIAGRPDGNNEPIILGMKFTSASETCNVFANNYPWSESEMRAQTERTGIFGLHWHYAH